MLNYFTPMNDAYRNKVYPNGFMEGTAKHMKFFGNIVCVLGVVLLVSFTPLVILGANSAIKGISSVDSYNITTELSFVAIGLSFVIPAIFCLLHGIKVNGKSLEKLISVWAKKNNYTENIIQHYINQVLNDDTYIMNMVGECNAKNNTSVGFLTKDFLALRGAIIKLEDIIGIYLVDTFISMHPNKNRMRYEYVLQIAVCAKNRSIMCPVKEEARNELIEILASRNLNFDTREDRILSEKEYREVHKSFRTLWK